MDENYYWLGFSLCNGIGPVKFQQLLTYFGTAERAWEATEQELINSGVGNSVVARIVEHKKKFDLDSYLERMQRKNSTFVTLRDDAYPTLLKQTTKPPYVLYVMGDIAVLNAESTLAVVGTRKVTDYGKQVTEILTKELAEIGFVIVSGLALGVDAIAHAAALSVKGRTVAVLGSGVDYCTPRENEGIYTHIIEGGGAIISEAPLGQIPNKGSFPSRNRIIAGMSAGVLVTEGAEDSGSLITASYALESSRTVFAVPGPITSAVSKGTNVLIAKGAKMVASSKDIIDVLRLTSGHNSVKKNTQIKGDTKEEQKIIDLLIIQDMHFDELVRKTGFGSAQVGTLLSLLEMKGYIRTLSAGGYSLAV